MGLMNSPPLPPSFVLGFNFVIDRISTMRLMAAIGAAIEKQAPSVTICISSPGGAPDQAFYAYEILRALPIEIITHNVGTVASTAVTLFLAGSTRYAVENSVFLLHKTTHNPPPGTSYGVDQLEHSQESIAADDERAMVITGVQTGQPLKTVRRWFAGQKLRDSAFAKANGLISDIRPVAVPNNGQFFQITLS